MVRFMPGDVRIYHGDTFSGVILKELGFKRPGDQIKMTLQNVMCLKSVSLQWMEISFSTSHTIKVMRKKVLN